MADHTKENKPGGDFTESHLQALQQNLAEMVALTFQLRRAVARRRLLCPTLADKAHALDVAGEISGAALILAAAGIELLELQKHRVLHG